MHTAVAKASVSARLGAGGTQSTSLRAEYTTSEMVSNAGQEPKTFSKATGENLTIFEIDNTTFPCHGAMLDRHRATPTTTVPHRQSTFFVHAMPSNGRQMT